MGLTVVPHKFGFFRTSESAPHLGFVTVTKLSVADVPKLLADVREHFGDAVVSIDVEDETYTSDMSDAFVRAGWTDSRTTVFLAYVGTPPPAPALAIERVDETLIDEFSRAKLMGFADSEDEPTAESVKQDSALRLGEMNGSGNCLMTRVDGEAGSICAYYNGDDWLIFLLATRVPFRHRGLGRGMLFHVLDKGRDARSVIINAEQEEPEALYRSLGFTDVVHRRWSFRKPS